jgi:hypothetical protein
MKSSSFGKSEWSQVTVTICAQSSPRLPLCTNFEFPEPFKVQISMSAYFPSCYNTLEA